MIERGKDVRFPLEARKPVRIEDESLGQDLDGDIASQLRVPRAIDFSHAPGAMPERISYDPSREPAGKVMRAFSPWQVLIVGGSAPLRKPTQETCRYSLCSLWPPLGLSDTDRDLPPARAYTCAVSRHRSARFHRRSSTTVVVLSFIVVIGLSGRSRAARGRIEVGPQAAGEDDEDAA